MCYINRALSKAFHTTIGRAYYVSLLYSSRSKFLQYIFISLWSNFLNLINIIILIWNFVITYNFCVSTCSSYNRRPELLIGYLISTKDFLLFSIFHVDCFVVTLVISWKIDIIWMICPYAIILNNLPKNHYSYVCYSNSSSISFFCFMDRHICFCVPRTYLTILWISSYDLLLFSLQQPIP